MKDPNCDVEVGIHPGPFWYDPDKDLQVCSRHKDHYEERDDEFGPFNWERGTRGAIKAKEKMMDTLDKAATHSKSIDVIQSALDAIDEVLNIHENHLFPSNQETLLEAKKRLEEMKNDFRILT